MYQFINDYPKNIETAWTHECQGVCHDSHYWYMTQDGAVWKFPKKWDFNKKIDANNLPADVHYKPGKILVPDPKKDNEKAHLGDMDYHGGYLFIADDADDKNGNPNTYISVYDASTLKYVQSQAAVFYDHRFKSIGWCAINHGFLYTSDTIVNKDNPVYIYRIEMDRVKKGQPNFLTPWARMFLREEDGDDLTLENMQGGCFDQADHLHLANGFHWDLVWERKKEGISVFNAPAIPAKNSVHRPKRLAKSSQSGSFKYKFNTAGQEPEGLTWWDLDNAGVPGIKGCLHVILLNNDVRDEDNVYFKHFKPDNPSLHTPGPNYTIRIRTSNTLSATTTSEVYLTLLGTSGISEEYKLETPDGSFNRATTDYFQINVRKKLGTLAMLQVRLGSSGAVDDWHLQDIEIIDEYNRTVYNFPCKRWLDETREDGKTVRILHAEGTPFGK